MKVLEQTSTILKLQISQYPYFVAKIVLLFVILLPCFDYFNKSSVLRCDRIEPTQVACDLTTSGLLGTYGLLIPVGQLQRAEVEIHTDSDDDDTYQIVLVTQTERIAFSRTDSDKTDAQYKVDQINSFLSSSQRSTLTIRKDHRWLLYLFIGVYTLISVFLLIRKKPTLCIFDKSSNQLFVKYRNILRFWVSEYILSDLSRLEIVEKEDSDGDKSYKALLVFASGENICLSTSSAKRDQYKIAGLINSYLA